MAMASGWQLRAPKVSWPPAFARDLRRTGGIVPLGMMPKGVLGSAREFLRLGRSGERKSQNP